MQRLCELIDPDNGEPLDEHGESLLESLFETVGHQRCKSPIGQFDPGGAGGANAASGYDAASSINTWDYILMLEGALAFASAAVKRLERIEPGALAYPFCVQSAGIGYGSADQTDEAASRNEMWLPLWDTEAHFGELASLLAEGRVEIRGRRARNGVDFARAIASLGIDRGISVFQRYGFQQRNGLAYFAVPLGRFAVRGDIAIEELLAPITSWLDRFRRTALSKNAPSRAARALRRLETAIFEFCQRGEAPHVQDVLIALGYAEAAVAISPKLRDTQTGITPVPPLTANWLEKANDGSSEYHLAAALASIGYGESEKIGPLRRHIEPIDSKTLNSRWPKWSASANDPNIVWGGGGLVRNMIRVLNRRMIEAVRNGKQPGDDELLFPGEGRYCASLGDIAAFIKGDVDDERIESLLRGLMLINWRYVGRDALQKLAGKKEPMPDAAYALLKLCHLPYQINGQAVRLTPALTRRAVAGDIAEATRLAARRLRGSGLSPAIEVAHGHGRAARRTAAALLFPVWQSRTPDEQTPNMLTDVQRLAKTVLTPDDDLKNTTDTADKSSAAV